MVVKGSAISFITRITCALTLLLAAGCGPSWPPAAGASPDGTETIVLIRHGEKPPGGLGQLSCRGLNRSMALPRVLVERFGRANAIFAPDPGAELRENPATRRRYSYVRPLATIEPTAIALTLPVNTQISYKDIDGLQKAVTASQYADSTIFIAWEHLNAYKFAQQMLTTYGLDPSQVPTWANDDYDMIYIFQIKQTGGKPELTFSVQQEGLSGLLSDACPTL